MLDIKFIRDNKDLIIEAARKKHLKFDPTELLKLDDKRKELLSAIETKRAEQNAVSLRLPQLADAGAKAELLSEMKKLKEGLQKEEEQLKEIMKNWQVQMLAVPNVPDVSVPEGKDETENVEACLWGEKPVFDFKIKDHAELMLKLDMVDFERGTKTHGFRGYFLKNDGANLTWAIWNYAREFFGSRSFNPFIAPAIVKKEHFYGTGHLPRDSEDLFKTQDDDFLSGTAEVPMMAYHSGEILKSEELPKRYLAFSPCYRREAGSYSKDTRGLIRVHEFFKLEQLIICKADHAESAKLHEEINRNFEQFIESLGLPYRRLLICGGDLGQSKVKQYDTEAWFPFANTYRELSSASYYHDFQTRRFNIRYDEGGKKLVTHSLNCTAAATPRLLSCIVENYQQADGTIKIPEVLRKYMGGKEFIGKK
ncbi:MAG: serine--tRNA ligase [Candidatus Paceibacterota bacterium]|jgi:seryl-tRNA synthetase